MSYSLKIKFLGAVGTVTGSRTLIEYQGDSYLIDCGLFQGPALLREKNWKPFLEAKKIKALVLTHAHIDHTGYIPKFVKEGFRGPIYCTEATQALSEIMLVDSAHLQEEDARYANKSKYSKYSPALPLYEISDAKLALTHFRSLPLNEWKNLRDGLSFRLIRSGHILGSSFVQISFMTEVGPKLLTFSGDLGNSRSSILESPETIKETDYLVMESTYGDRRQDRSETSTQLAGVINTVISRGGTLVIPAFSVGRTQELLHLISRLIDSKKIPPTPIYLDSPMASSATKIHLKFPEYLKKEFSIDELSNSLSRLHFKEVTSTDESMLLCMSTEPKVIISAAGMLTGGRVMHHLKAKLPDDKSGVLFVGFQAQETKGLLLKNGLKSIRIHHKLIEVEAEVFSIDSLSAHGDSDDILSWIQKIVKKPDLIMLNHGESSSLATLAYRIRNELNLNVLVPNQDEEIIIK